MTKNPTRGKRSRAAEAAAAAAEFAPTRGPSRRMIQGTIASLDENAARYESGGMPVSAARCRTMALAARERLAALDA